ncbi:MAG: ribokinase [Lachnospiraceae bacterium]|nr:ribokinase [Lachnospiraceae bacterium]
MPKILNYGSLNLDYVYEVEHFVQPGETIASKSLSVNCGGKGLNQSIACARAGGEVFHAGKIGAEGGMLKAELDKSGVNTSFLVQDGGSNGHAIIQVNAEGNNCILLYAGSNHQIKEAEIEACLDYFGAGDYLVLQNEVNHISYMIDRAYEKGMYIVLNPSPITEELKEYPLHKVSLFLLNEVEGKALSGEMQEEKIPEVLKEKYPEAEILLTLGERGSIYFDGEMLIKQKAYPVKAVDTTAAGDTFTGYFVALRAGGRSVEEALDLASKAAGMACARKGAAASIPELAEVNMQW